MQIEHLETLFKHKQLSKCIFVITSDTGFQFTTLHLVSFSFVGKNRAAVFHIVRKTKFFKFLCVFLS